MFRVRTMGRREFGAFVAMAASAAGVSAVYAQLAGRKHRIGVLMAIAADDPEALLRVKSFEASFPSLEWIKGRDIDVDYRWASGDLSTIRAAAAELVATAPEVIVTVGTPVLAALRSVTKSIPIVFAGVSAPVGAGVVASMARPGENVTGFANFEPSISGRWLQTLKEAAPNVEHVAVLRNPDTLASFIPPLSAAAPEFGFNVTDCVARTTPEIKEVLGAFAGQKDVGLIVLPDPSFTAQRRAIVEVAAHQSMPAIYPFRSFAVDGGLMVYGVNVADQVKRSAFYVDRILKGEKPGELPVQAPTKFDLVINLRTAKSLGLTIPFQLISTADEVIE